MKKKVKILFLYQHTVHWINAVKLFEFMRNSNEFEPQILLVPTLNEQNQFKEVHKELEEYPDTSQLSQQNIAFKYLDEVNIEHFDAAIFLTPDETTRPEKFRSYRFLEQGLKIFYIPYALDIGGGKTNIFNQYMLDIHRIATGIFVRSEFNKQNYKHYCPSGDEHVYTTGLPLFDAMHEANQLPKQTIKYLELLEKTENRIPIIWNSHYSFDGNIWSTFDVMAETFFKLAQANPNLALIWRPHPWTFNKLHSYRLLTNETEKQFINEIERYGVIIDTSPDFMDSFHVSKAIMTDASSLLLSSLAFDKPILYLRNPRGRGLEPEGESLLESIDVAETPNQAIQFIEKIFAGIDDLDSNNKAPRKKALAKHLYGYDGNASSRIANIIKNLI